MVQIYHNPRCSKSRQTLALLEEKGIDVDVIKYLETPPTAADILKLKNALGISSLQQMMRKGESVYKEMGLKNVKDKEALIIALVQNPILLERPIVVNGSKARIGRPPEKVLEIL